MSSSEEDEDDGEGGKHHEGDGLYVGQDGEPKDEVMKPGEGARRRTTHSKISSMCTARVRARWRATTGQ